MISIITGAGGFIGSHLAKYLKAQGHTVIGVDIKRPEFDVTACDEFWLRDIRDYDVLPFYHYRHDESLWFWALAANMGGMEFLHGNDATILYDNAKINLNTLEWARELRASRYLFSSSACVYPETLQLEEDVIPLKEIDAYPAWPDLEYGWEKLFTERVVSAYGRDYDMETRIVRFHNVYGINTQWNGVRAKAPAALSRKVAVAKLCGHDHISVFGDGKQTRTYMSIEDCLEGIWRLMNSDFPMPVNLGRDELISVDDLAKTLMEIAGVDLQIEHDLTKPQGVRGRSSDNALVRKLFDWQPPTDLKTGLTTLYNWVENEVKAALERGESVV